jgi:ABC-type Fe3+ transport system substrate-binding protein
MNLEISPQIKVADIVRLYPETKDVFVSHGLGALVSEDGLRVLAPFLSLGAALRAKFLGVEPFVKQLENAIEQPKPLDAPGLSDFSRQRDLTLLALMPCGLKMPFSRAITGFLEDLRQEQGLNITYAVEGNLNQELSYYPYVETINDVDELPDIVVSADFNTFYGRRFYEKFVATGLFTGYGSFCPNQWYQRAGIVEPKGEYSVLGINPLVMVANLDQTGDRPLPTCWKDLLSPIWKKSVTLRGGNGFYCHAVLLPTYQRYGALGLEQLADNVVQGLHPAQMVKQIDSDAPGAIYVMPEFFAHRVKHQDRIRVLWPDDGALASPVTLQVKATKVEELRPILEYLTGKELARVLVGARFPVPHGDVKGEVQNRPLMWLGWDYLRRDDLLALNEEIDAIFMPRVQAQ